ncbi:DUF6916 family protein [Brevundimonas sp.]|uniref:DUF6916 family protein n=1 Tax=Brevundimonas sp. TaxID=1871086 RepID=UPI003D0C6C46
MMDLHWFSRAANQEFDLSLGETALALTLVEVAPLPHGGGLRQPFSLIFRGASAVVLPQKLYALSNATLGKLSVFLVPIGRDNAGVLYQAVFN